MRIAAITTFMVLALVASGAQAQVLCWTTKDGKRQCGDTPPPGVKATPIGSQAVPPAPAPAAAPAAPGASAAPGAAAKKPAAKPAARRRRRKPLRRKSWRRSKPSRSSRIARARATPSAPSKAASGSRASARTASATSSTSSRSRRKPSAPARSWQRTASEVVRLPRSRHFLFLEVPRNLQRVHYEQKGVRLRTPCRDVSRSFHDRARPRRL